MQISKDAKASKIGVVKRKENTMGKSIDARLDLFEYVLFLKALSLSQPSHFSKEC